MNKNATKRPIPVDRQGIKPAAKTVSPAAATHAMYSVAFGDCFCPRVVSMVGSLTRSTVDPHTDWCCPRRRSYLRSRSCPKPRSYPRPRNCPEPPSCPRQQRFPRPRSCPTPPSYPRRPSYSRLWTDPPQWIQCSSESYTWPWGIWRNRSLPEPGQCWRGLPKRPRHPHLPRRCPPQSNKQHLWKHRLPSCTEGSFSTRSSSSE